jgi:hypothetical protein
MSIPNFARVLSLFGLMRMLPDLAVSRFLLGPFLDKLWSPQRRSAWNWRKRVLLICWTQWAVLYLEYVPERVGFW